MPAARKNFNLRPGVAAALLALMAAGTPLRARDEAVKTEKPRAAKAKTAAAKRPATPLPFLQLPEQKAARAEVEASSLAPALKKKLLAGDPLSLTEIEELGRAGLNPELVVKCLRTAGGTYEVLTKDIDRLRAAGLADSVLDYLLTTRSRRVPYYSSPYLYYGHSWLHHDDHHLFDLHHSDSHFGSSTHHH